MKKVLVTGGAGFIGSNLCKKLSNYEVIVVDNLHKQIHGDNPPTMESLIVGDVTDINTWKEFYNYHFDAIVCLAAETGTGQSMMCAQNYCNTNIGSIALLNDLIVSNKIKADKVILASSRSVYGDAIVDKNGEPIASKETDVTNPQSIYAVTKLCQEQVLFAGFRNTQVSALRFQNVYGPGQSLKNPYTGIISIFTNAIKNNNNIQLFDDGLMSRDFVYIDDVVDSLILAIEGKTKDREVYNVGSGTRTTVLKVAETLKKLHSSNIQINITGEKMKGDIRHNYADITKLSGIGYVPKVTFDQGITNFVEWVNEFNVVTDNDYLHSIKTLRDKGILN